MKNFSNIIYSSHIPIKLKIRKTENQMAKNKMGPLKQQLLIGEMV